MIVAQVHTVVIQKGMVLLLDDHRNCNNNTPNEM